MKKIFYNRLISKSTLGRYPSCDHLNNALRDLLRRDDTDDLMKVIKEIYYAIVKSGGYFHPDVSELLRNKGFTYSY